MTSLLRQLTSQRKLLLGVVHLRPLPGSPRFEGRLEAVVDSARADCEAILEAGFDGYVLENFGDLPFHPGPAPAHVISCMTRVACELRRTGAFVVVNVLRNDAAGALAIAAATGLQAVRVNVHCGAAVTDQGIIEGRAAETLRLRNRLAPEVAILADVDVKHAVPLGHSRRLEDDARDVAYRGLADALIVTGPATGADASPDDLRAVSDAVPDRPILVGSGVAEENVAQWLQQSSGAIVGSSVKRGGRVEEPVDAARARRLVQAARG
ncbi:MAG: BtpA/SgcQ family protein [Planctomycetota bacterium]|nr:BtpA/SgcQ family protein [Planctomycetota bacterium]